MDLEQWRKHIDQIVADEGQWWGVADEEGIPIYELVGVGTFPKSHITPSSAEFTVSHVQEGDRVLDDLVGNKLGEVDEDGRLTPASGPTRLLVLVRAGERRAATITHTIVAGKTVPSQVTIHGVDLVDGLSWWPCPSVPVEWNPTTSTKKLGMAVWETYTQDESFTRYAVPRTLTRVPFATRLTGYYEEGPARTVVRNTIQDAFDAVNALKDWQPHAVVAYDGGEDSTPFVQLRVNDDPIMDTVQETARQAGLTITVDLWWPGDDPVVVRSDQEGETTTTQLWDQPMQIVQVREFKET